jgi:predicted DNA-binding antitoxin AbrB/MazE fold protein
METFLAEFDGKVFVPCEPVNLPAGTRVEVSLPWPPGKLTLEQKAVWEELKKSLDSTEPHFQTVEDAMRYSRKYP